ncbi:MAG: mechanosensitive ion channel family protein [Myxococcales bacterium]|nr:mechanosensitive ion channel family protein [Myxococcales bacterium]
MSAARVLPEVFYERSFGPLALWQWAVLLALFGGGLLLAMLVERGLLGAAQKVAKLTATQLDDQLVLAAKGPLALLLWVLISVGGLRLISLPPLVVQALNGVVRSLAIVAFVWFLLRMLRAGGELLESRVPSGALDARERSLRTQVAVFRRLAELAVWLVGAALLLMQFDLVRSVGVSVLASAGIAGLVFGLAAQRSIAMLLAGIQLSLTQPIRIGDVVVVEGQFGTVEEIRLTYVVVKVWDMRRLVLPITHFLEKPFENLTRGEPQLLCTVNLSVDYSADVEAIRSELKRLLEAEAGELWDGRAWNLQVTESGPDALTVRALLSAADPSKAWDLRCLVRERLVRFVQRRSSWLPLRRIASSPAPAPHPAGDRLAG